MATVVESDLKVPFLLATALRCRVLLYSLDCSTYS